MKNSLYKSVYTVYSLNFYLQPTVVAVTNSFSSSYSIRRTRDIQFINVRVHQLSWVDVNKSDVGIELMEHADEVIYYESIL